MGNTAHNPVAPPQRPLRPVPIPPPRWPFHRIRKWIHLACFFIFVALPFFNVMRFDIPRQRFYFAGQELWINEFAIIFFSLLFLLFVVVGMAVLYGRIYCGYLCPQTIFSEAAQAFEALVTRRLTRKFISWPAKRRRIVERVISLSVIAVASVFLAFVFISYFVEPRDLLGRLMRFDLVTAGGLSGAIVTLITFLDFALVRQTFCTTACPYGYLQGMLVDKNSLLVEYHDEPRTCIECKKCVRVCPMGIDIRDSPHQIECTHCGECVDACTDVLGRLGRPTLISYTWGEHAEADASKPEPWYRRIGLRDAKRVAALAMMTFYASGLAVALSMRHPVLVQLNPERSQKLYAVTDSGAIANRFRARMANRSSERHSVTFRAEGLAGVSLSIKDTVTLRAGEEQEVRFDVVAPADKARPEVSHFTLFAHASDGSVDRFPVTFLGPREKK